MRYGPRVPCLVLDHSCQRACLVYEDDVVFFAEYLEKSTRECLTAALKVSGVLAWKSARKNTSDQLLDGVGRLYDAGHNASTGADAYFCPM